MIEFVIKSTVCLAVLYGFYYFLLKNLNAFVFNRFYLLFSLAFALIVPFINIKVAGNHSVIPMVNGFSNATLELVQGEAVADEAASLFTVQFVLLILYLVVSALLLVRFILNMYKITRIIHSNSVIDKHPLHFVLLEKQLLPYSFFTYIFISRSDYENGNADKGLIDHERTHCAQLHSLDILVIELIKVVLWFNPFVWLFGKAIQLNHEYLADNKVLTSHDLNAYQNVLVNHVFRNNSSYLASNFNYSLTKKRLIMMTKNISPENRLFRKAITIPVVLVVFIVLAFSQENKPNMSLLKFEKEWWYHILQKHNVEPSGFNYFDEVFEMGTKNTIDNQKVILENAFFLIRTTGDEYVIIRSRLAYHDLDKNIIEGKSATLEKYSTNSPNTKPLERHKMKNIVYFLNGHKGQWKAQGVEGMVDLKTPK